MSQDTKKFDCFDLGHDPMDPRSLELPRKTLQPSGQATQRPPAWTLDLADLQDAPCGDPGHATSQRLWREGVVLCGIWDI